MERKESLVQPFRSFPEHESIKDVRLARQYAIFAQEYPVYRKLTAGPLVLARAMALYFVENLLARQGSSGYSEDKEYLFNRVFEEDLAIVGESDLTAAHRKYLDKGVLLKAFSKHFQSLEKLTSGKTAEDISFILCEQFNNSESSLETVCTLLFRCLALTARKGERGTLGLNCSGDQDPANALLVAQHLDLSIVFFKNLAELRLGSRGCISGLFFWQGKYALVYPKGNSIQKYAPVCSFLAQPSKGNSHAKSQSAYKALLSSPARSFTSCDSQKQSKSPSSSHKNRREVAIQAFDLSQFPSTGFNSTRKLYRQDKRAPSNHSEERSQHLRTQVLAKRDSIRNQPMPIAPRHSIRSSYSKSNRSQSDQGKLDSFSNISRLHQRKVQSPTVQLRMFSNRRPQQRNRISTRGQRLAKPSFQRMQFRPAPRRPSRQFLRMRSPEQTGLLRQKANGPISNQRCNYYGLHARETQDNSWGRRNSKGRGLFSPNKGFASPALQSRFVNFKYNKYI